MALFREEFPSSKASELGTYLEVPQVRLQEFSHDHVRDCNREMLAVLNYWLENSTDRSWKKLAEAVEYCGCKVLSEKILRRYTK